MKKLPVSEKPTQFIIAYSGGINSTVLVLEWIRRHFQEDKELYPMPVILYYATGVEFPEVDNNIKFIKNYCESLNVPFETVHPDYTFEESILEERWKYKGEWKTGRGWPMSKRACWCYDYKKKIITEYVRVNWNKKGYSVTGLFGFTKEKEAPAANLKKREHRPNAPTATRMIKFPLIEWDYNFEYCKKYFKEWKDPLGVTENTLDYSVYERFGGRSVGCYCCPFYGRNIYRIIYRDYPKLFYNMLKWDKKTEFKLMHDLVNLRYWFASEIITGEERVKRRQLKNPDALEYQYLKFKFGDDKIENHDPALYGREWL